MIRDLILTSAVLSCVLLAFRNPMAGVLAWIWIGLMQPHREVYGVFSSTMRLNLTVAVVTVLALFLSKERRLPKVDGTFVVVAMLLSWMMLSNLVAVSPEWSWYVWDRVWKTFLLGIMVGALANSKIRIHAITWVIVLSVGYYGVKGGLLSLTSGGAKKITGPALSEISDNNHLALALLMILPLVNYLRLHTASRYVRTGLLIGGALTFLAVLGSYSRGAFVALAALALVGWLRSRNKFVYPIAVAVVAVPALLFMPQEFHDRMNTIHSLENDDSFQGRLQAWKVALGYAKDHFPFGAGFAGPQTDQVFHTYMPGVTSHAAHSIYFEVLGEHGFMGLGLFVVILIMAFANVRKIRKAAFGHPELTWAYDLATSIQLGMVAYCVGGAALSLAYFDVPIMWYLMLPALYQLVQSKTQKTALVPMSDERAYAGKTAAVPG